MPGLAQAVFIVPQKTPGDDFGGCIDEIGAGDEFRDLGAVGYFIWAG